MNLLIPLVAAQDPAALISKLSSADEVEVANAKDDLPVRLNPRPPAALHRLKASERPPCCRARGQAPSTSPRFVRSDVRRFGA